MNLSGLHGPASPATSSSPGALHAWLALAVVFVMLATTGWTAVHRPEENVSARRVALASWSGARIGGRPVPSADAPIRTVARFFSELDGPERDRLADTYPLVVGNLDGVPAQTRFRANRRSLAQASRTEEKRAQDVSLTPADRDEASRREHRLESLADPARQVLVFDPTGDGLVAEVFGDLDRAQRVSVIVPGVDTDLLTFERSQRRYSAPVGMAESSTRPSARRLRAPGPRSSPGPGTSAPPGSVWTRRPAGWPRRAPYGWNRWRRPCPGTRRWRCSATATDRWCAGSPPATCRAG